MSRRGASRPAGLRWLFLAAAIPLFGLYLRTLSPTVPFEDGGEMIAPAFTLGINHPPGYPLYALAGRLAACLPLGDIAFRLNLLSAACGAAACGLAACVAFRILAGVPGVRAFVAWPASLAGGIMLGTSSQLWWQSVIAEKYSLNLFLNGLLALAMVNGLAQLRVGSGRGARAALRWLPLMALAWGISASHHGQTVYFAPAAALLGWWAFERMPQGARLRWAVLLVLLAVLGLSVKALYPPIRSATSPLFNWNSPDILPRYADYVAGGPYQSRIFYWTPWQVATRLVRHLGQYPIQQFGIPGVALGLLGLAWLAGVRRREALVLALVWAAGVAYCVNFSLEGIAVQTYYLPTFMILAVWIACGLAAAARWIGAREIPALSVAAGVLFLGWGGWQAADHGRLAARDRHYFAWDFSRALLRSVEPHGILIAYTDYDLFPLWYTHYIVGVRPDVILVNSNFLQKKGSTETSEGAKVVQFLFPRGHEALAKRLGYLDDLLRADPGRPVFFSVVYESIERFDLLPHGAAYRFVRDPGMMRRADVLAERRWFARWRTVRGVFDSTAARDSNTRITLSYYPYGDYRRGCVLERQGRAGEAQAMYRSALAWPDFWGYGSAAAHASIGLFLYRNGRDVAGAVHECEEAIGLKPEWKPAYRTLGAIHVAERRYADALKVFRKVLELDPADPVSRADIRRLEALAGGRR